MIPLKRGLAKYSLTSRTPSSCCSLIIVKVLIMSPDTTAWTFSAWRCSRPAVLGRGDCYSLMVLEIARARASFCRVLVYDSMGTQSGRERRERGHARV